MNDHRKKKLAPIAVTVILVLFYCAYFGFIISFLPPVWKIIVGIVPLIFGVLLIYVCIQRLHEIDGGEEDDLSKY